MCICSTHISADIKGLSMSRASVHPEAPPVRPEDISVLAAHAGLALSPAHLAELVDAYGYIAPMLARIRRHRPATDEPAHVFVAATFQAMGGKPA
jgi:hypothetical protein